jgi:hypothetical protein
MYYGCDSNSNDFPCSADFYIGRIGYGTTADDSVFNYQAAAKVGCTRTWSYWFLQGPSAAPPGTTAYDWGKAQADAAIAAWGGNASVCGHTVYGDVEGPGQYGWSYLEFQNNSQVWQGFYDELSGSSALLNPGLYSSAFQWTHIMDTYQVAATTPVWSADQTNSVGCENCPTEFPALPPIGGVSPTIWQYNSTSAQGGCPSDLDLASELPPD